MIKGKENDENSPVFWFQQFKRKNKDDIHSRII